MGWKAVPGHDPFVEAEAEEDLLRSATSTARTMLLVTAWVAVAVAFVVAVTLLA